MFHSLRRLKLQVLCQPLHVLIEHVAQLACVSFQNLACLSHVLRIFFIALSSDTWAETVVYVIFEARFERPPFHRFACEKQTAGARLVEFFYKFEHGIHARRVAVRAEEGAELFVYVPRLEDARIILVRYADAGVGLSVFQKNVVAGVIFFYETVLKKQSILLAVHDRIADVPNLRHQYLCLVAVHLFVEVGRHTALEVLCLAHIYYRVALVIVLIAAGFLRHVQHDVLQTGEALFIFFFSHTA